VELVSLRGMRRAVGPTQVFRMAALPMMALDLSRHYEVIACGVGDLPAHYDPVWDDAVDPKGESATRIPPGPYQARVIEAKRHYLHKHPKLILTVEIVQHQLAGERLQFYCAYPKNPGKHSAFIRAWEVANGESYRRRDRVSLRVFKQRLFRILVRDVTTDRHQRPLARPYSVVDRFLERLS
jgi:hypothetical protein